MIERLAAALRERAVPVSTAEVLDAVRSLEVLGVHDAVTTIGALRAALVKHGRHDEAFDRALAACLAEALGLLAVEDPPAPDATDGSPEIPMAPSAPLPETGVRGEADERVHVGVDAQPPDGADPVRRPGGTSPGDTGMRAGDAVGDPGAPIVHLPYDGPDDDDRRPDPAVVVHLPEVPEDHLPVEPSTPEGSRRPLGRPLVDDVGRSPGALRAAAELMNPFTATERRLLDDAARRFAALLPDVAGHRATPRPHGRLDARRTARSSTATGGVPFRPVVVGPTRRPTELLVLADVSLSVRATSRLVLHLVHALPGHVRRCRTLAFVDHPVDVTALIRDHGASRAVAALAAGTVLDTTATSDIGRTFELLWRHHRGMLRRDVTVIVLSDGRGNGTDPRVDLVDDLRRRCALLRWVSPEPPGAWTMGFGEMAAYAGAVDEASCVRTLDDLRRWASTPARRDRLTPGGASGPRP